MEKGWHKKHTDDGKNHYEQLQDNLEYSSLLQITNLVSNFNLTDISCNK